MIEMTVLNGKYDVTISGDDWEAADPSVGLSGGFTSYIIEEIRDDDGIVKDAARIAAIELEIIGAHDNEIFERLSES